MIETWQLLKVLGVFQVNPSRPKFKASAILVAMGTALAVHLP